MTLRLFISIGCGFVVLGLLVGTWRNPNFWLTPDQRGDLLFRDGKFKEAAKVYADPPWSACREAFGFLRPVRLKPLNPPQF